MLLRMNTADTDSQVIHFLRLPLVVLVLLIHSNFHGTSEAWNALWAAGAPSVGPAMPTLGTIIDIISGSLAQLANPFSFSSADSCSSVRARSQSHCTCTSCETGSRRCSYLILFGTPSTSLHYWLVSGRCQDGLPTSVSP